MAYEPKKIFIIENGEYAELTHEEHLIRKETDKAYREKKFIGLHGMIMEVSGSFYEDFYREKRRQKYLDERSRENGDVSYDALTSDEFNGENILVDRSEDIAEQVIQEMMQDKLKRAMLMLLPEEQLLIYRHYYANISETELSGIYGISQQAISKRIAKIRRKLKKLMET